MSIGTDTLTVLVFAPNHEHPLRFEWNPSTIVGRAAVEAAEKFGLHVGQTKPSFLNEANRILDLTKTLEQAGVRTGDKLELVTSGGGVMPLSAEETLAWVELELKGARHFAERKGFTFEWNADELTCRVTLVQPKTGRKFYLLGDFSDYRELPPNWWFTDERFDKRGVGFIPKPIPRSNGIASVFHPAYCICAPFNRRAYPGHVAWGGPAQWQSKAPDRVQAHTIADMLAVVVRDLTDSEEVQ